jgi:hypothetical protein
MMPALFDPDYDWRSLDKVQHAAAGFALCLGFNLVLAIGDAFLIAVWTLAVFEAGQTDVAHSLRRLGIPGFGFGLLDLAFGIAGAGLWVGFASVL